VAFLSVRSHSTTGVPRFTRLQVGTRVPASDAFHRQLLASISSPWHGLQSGAHFAGSLPQLHQASAMIAVSDHAGRYAPRRARFRFT
jgi:hypothetical protein